MKIKKFVLRQGKIYFKKWKKMIINKELWLLSCLKKLIEKKIVLDWGLQINKEIFWIKSIINRNVELSKLFKM